MEDHDPDTIADATRTVREESVGWLIQRLSARLNRAMAEALVPFGLTQREFAILMTVLEHGPIRRLSQADIAARFEMPAYAISRAIDGLSEKGLVDRRPVPGSRRSHGIAATARAKELAPQLHAVVRSVNAGFLAPLDPDESAALAGALRRLHQAGDQSP